MNTTDAIALPDADLLRRYDLFGPRYTSYPTALQFSDSFQAQDYAEATARARAATPGAPLSVYIHVPFCASPCFYCGCNRVITRDPLVADIYVRRLLEEIALHAALIGRGRRIEQLHFGGGTPTFLNMRQLDTVLGALDRSFGFVGEARREFSIEVDPRTVSPDGAHRLAALGFNRLSLGVQDFDPAVQQAVNRAQSFDLVAGLVEAARAADFRSISMDLIHGLPRQTPQSFGYTLDLVQSLAPDRIAAYAYAHLPARFKAQRQIRLDELPDAATRLALAHGTAERLLAGGYVHIGMDHYALPGDALAQALANGSLQRNFQGYSTRASLDLIGLGVSAIGRIGDSYAQNARTLPDYYRMLDEQRLPIDRGLRLSVEDQLRADVIGSIMCRGELRYAEIDARHGIEFETHFADALRQLEGPAADGLLEFGRRSLRVTALGRHLLRVIAMPFDAYQRAADPAAAGARYSRVL